MTAQEKVNYVKHEIKELAKVKGNMFVYEIYTSMEEGADYPLVSRTEKLHILDRLVEQGYLRKPEEFWNEGFSVGIEVLPKLLDEVIDLEDDEDARQIVIYISERYGIYTNEKTKKPSYPIKKGKRFQLLMALKDFKIHGAEELEKHQGQSITLISKEIGKINSLVCEKLGLKNDLIIHSDTGGYTLNADVFEIKFVDQNQP